MKSSSIIFVFLLFIIQGLKGEEFLDVGSIMEDPIYLTKFITVFEDKSKQPGIEDIQKTEYQSQFKQVESSEEAFNFALSNSAFWLRIPLENTGSEKVELKLDISYPLLELVDFYIPQGDRFTVLKSGYTIPHSELPYKHRYIIFPFTIKEKTKDYFYVRITSINSINVPIRIWNDKSFMLQERNDYVQQALYFGVLFSMGIFNLFLFFAIKDKYYLLYVLFVFLSGLAVASAVGIGNELLWRNNPGLTRISLSLFVSLAFIVCNLFMRGMLELPKNSPGLNRIGDWMIGLLVAVLILFLYDFSGFVKVLIYTQALFTLYLLLTGIVSVIKRQRAAYFFAVAFVFLFSMLFLSILRVLGFLPSNIVTNFGVQIGSAMEMMFLAFALADRYNLIRKEKEKAEMIVKENLEKSNHELELKVKERTRELEETNKELSRLAILDGLTKIPNRRKFDEYLQIEWKNHLREGKPLVVILIDIDYFKKFNDHYGHQGGDECLVQVANIIARTPKRSGDLVARYGGEEFVAVLTNTDTNGGLEVAKSMQQAVESLAIPHAKSEIQSIVTLSLGVASLIPNSGSAPEDLISMADKALYKAKHLGRNRTCFYNDSF